MTTGNDALRKYLRSILLRTAALHVGAGMVSFLAALSWVLLAVIVWTAAVEAPGLTTAVVVARVTLALALGLFGYFVVWPLVRMPRLNQLASEIERRWWVVDADGQILGRLASAVASRLRGKDKPTYAPHMDTGDFVVVVNAARVRLTGRKDEQKVYRRHSGYPGGFRETPYKQMLATHPDRIIESAVRGMLPKNALGEQMFKKLKVYAGPEHPHQAQQPEPWTLTPDVIGGSAA